MFKVKIVIPYRPNVDAISSWSSDGNIPHREDTLNRCLFYLRKNSAYQHEFVIAIDSDISVESVEKSIKNMENVKIVQSNYTLSEYVKNASEKIKQKARINHTFISAHNSIADEDWVCYSYISDLIPCKDWDKLLFEQIQKRGENFAYVPMFVESFPQYGNGIVVKGEEITHDKIWNIWRENICCHALTLPEPKERDYITEKDIEHFCKVAVGGFNNIQHHSSSSITYHPEDGGNGVIIESADMRIFGYVAGYFIKNKYIKSILFSFPFESGGNNWEMCIDNKLSVQKVVVTNSFLFHPIITRFDDNK